MQTKSHDRSAQSPAPREGVRRGLQPAAAPGSAEGEPTRQLRQSVMVPGSTTFRGNKAALPSKPCVQCGRPMSWRRNWAKNWAEVKYCSEACRRARAARG